MYRNRHACMGVGTCTWTCMWRPEVGIHCLPQLLSNLIHRGRVSHLNAYSTDSSCLHSQLALKPLSVPHKENARGRGGRAHVPRLTGVLGFQIQIPALAWQTCYHQTIFLSTPRSFCFLLSFWLLLSELMGLYSDAWFLEWEHWLVWGPLLPLCSFSLVTLLLQKWNPLGHPDPFYAPTWSRQQTSDEGWRERLLKSLLIASAVLWPTLVIKVLPLSHRVQINSFCTGLGLSDILLRNLGASWSPAYLWHTFITSHANLQKKREKVANKIWFFNHGSNVSSYGIPGTDSWDPNSIAFET